MDQTDVLIIGASISGLASAACMQRRNLRYIVIEKEPEVAMPWRNHYERLHLHTNKRISNLPYKKFDSSIPRYPSRRQVVDYLETYREHFAIEPLFNTEANAIKKQGGYWITSTNNGNIQSKYLVMATGAFGKPKPVQFDGMETFPGKIIHSYGYKTGRDFTGQKVLVVGFGNSACEIALDLYEHGAVPFMAVRSPVNVIPRDVMGIPILELSQLMSRLPPRLADTINAPLVSILVGDLKKLGLRKLPYGPFEQIRKDGSIPLLDIGTITHIRQKHIKILDDIDRIEGKTVYFVSGKKEGFDAIIAAIGYYRDYASILDTERSRFDDLKLPVTKQKYFGKDGLYFCGFCISPTGQIREISLDAQKIAKDIAKKTRA